MVSLVPHLRATAALALPLIGSHMAQQAIIITDTVMTGWYGVEALAAVTLGSMIYFVIFIVGSGFAFAVMPMVAAAASAEDTRQVRRVTRMGLWISILAGLAMLPVFWFSGPILTALGQQPLLAAEAQGYLRIVGFALGLSLMIMVLKSHLAALEHTQIVLWATVAGAVLNAGLNWVLIFGRFGLPEMGIRGAAVASLGTYSLMFAILAVYAARARAMRPYTLFARIWRPDWEAFGQVFRLGWPIGLTHLAESGLFTASGLMMGWLGTVPLAAHGVAVQIASVTFMVHVGLSSAATVRTGRAWGRADLQGLRLGAAAALILSGAMVLLTVAAFLGLPGPLISLFLDPADPARPDILAIGTGLLAVAALFQLADAAQVMALGLLRGVQDTRVPMFYAILSYWALGIPASYLLGFPLGLGGPGIWLGLVIGLAVAAILMMTRFWQRHAGIAGAPAT
ncbi:MATE family efflux transporter [Rhodobacterales bacterium HKCCE3408]|nr:MATE family efflux transporter [Rhodobacterales bacterium HKCCE3408]